MNDTTKKIINVIIFVFIFVIANMLVQFGLTLFISAFFESLKGTPLLWKMIKYITALIAVTITIGVFHFAHFKTLQNLPDDERIIRKRNNSKLIGILLIAIYAFYFFGSKLSVFLYKISECKGGVGSGISCNGSMESIVQITQMLMFMISLGLGFILIGIFFLGLYFLARYSWKQAVTVFLIFTITRFV